MKIILGSQSPRRKKILSEILPEFEIIIPQIDETHFSDEKPQHFVTRISEEKAANIKSQVQNKTNANLVITSDTIVTYDNHILGKPSSYEDAVRTLSLLSSKTHEVITAITLSILSDTIDIIETKKEHTAVTFKTLTNETIQTYLDIIKYQDKAGSYAIQEQGAMIIESFQGSLSNIIGFPLRLFYGMLLDFNLVQSLIINKKSQ